MKINTEIAHGIIIESKDKSIAVAERNIEDMNNNHIIFEIRMVCKVKDIQKK